MLLYLNNMNRILNSLSRASASLDVDIDDIDTDDEGDGDDDLNIGWGGGAESADGRPLTEADVDPNALPVDTSSADDDDDDDHDDAACVSGVGDDDGADAEGIDCDFFDAVADWGDEEEDESPKSEEDAGDEKEDERVEAEAAADSSGTTGQPQQKRQKKTSAARHASVEVPAGGSIKYFSVDVGTSGSSRVRHGIVKLAQACLHCFRR